MSNKIFHFALRLPQLHTHALIWAKPLVLREEPVCLTIAFYANEYHYA